VIKFDDFAKQALLGRAYMFMDAQDLDLIEIKRHTVEPKGGPDNNEPAKSIAPASLSNSL
jgi:hypothetical protein